MTCHECFRRNAVLGSAYCLQCTLRRKAESRFKSGEEVQKRKICKRCKGEQALPGSTLGASCTRAVDAEAKAETEKPKRQVLETISDLDRKKRQFKEWKPNE